MKKIIASNALQKRYVYTRVEKPGANFDPGFTPDLTPKQMLQLGVFGGYYFEEMPKEFPKSWFVQAKLSDDRQSHKELNYFKVNASQSRRVWQQKGWMHTDDPYGWFQWYCRYFMGRRHEDDTRQIKRWKAMKRHVTQVRKNCKKGDHSCRKKQRQALLHWAYDSRAL